MDFKQIEFRLFKDSDDIIKLNALLLSAYKPLAEAGMRYGASHEDVEKTKFNVETGECYVAFYQNELVGCVTLRRSKIPVASEHIQPAWYMKPEVLAFGRFAVKPELQKNGLGKLIMDRVEEMTKAYGYQEIALDTSENAAHLIEFYKKRHYRFIEFHQWKTTNYRSVIMSKNLR